MFSVTCWSVDCGRDLKTGWNDLQLRIKFRRSMKDGVEIMSSSSLNGTRGSFVCVMVAAFELLAESDIKVAVMNRASANQ
jgi:hypothetical protein